MITTYQEEWMRTVAKSLPKMPQRQDSFSDQFIDLIGVANRRLGLYDAADLIKTH